MLAHAATDSLSLGHEGCHVAAIRHVRTTPFLIGSQVIRAHDPVVLSRHKHVMLGRKPVFKGVLSEHVLRQWVRFTAANYRTEDFPDGVVVGRCGRPNVHANDFTESDCPSEADADVECFLGYRMFDMPSLELDRTRLAQYVAVQRAGKVRKLV
jgi:hypothetical protein